MTELDNIVAQADCDGVGVAVSFQCALEQGWLEELSRDPRWKKSATSESWSYTPATLRSLHANCPNRPLDPASGPIVSAGNQQECVRDGQISGVRYGQGLLGRIADLEAENAILKAGLDLVRDARMLANDGDSPTDVHERAQRVARDILAGQVTRDDRHTVQEALKAAPKERAPIRPLTNTGDSRRVGG